jgi:dTDP-4-dehydrorhamnose 3,5-epimerase
VGEVLTTTPMIAGVAIHPLRQIWDERGAVLHMLRADAPHFESFGEIYFSVILPGAVKAWKRHREMVQNFAVPVGQIKLVIYDERSDSATCGVVQELVVGSDHYGLVRIPSRVWYGFRGIAEEASVIANCATLAHDPLESERIDTHAENIPYRW